MSEREEAIDFVIEKLLESERKRKKACGKTKIENTNIEKIKFEAARKYKIKEFIRSSEILDKLNPKERIRFLPILQKRPMRTLSGVTPVAVMIKPKGSCPYSCIYCPTGLGAKSYTGYEPAALRARQENFDPFGQVENRLAHFKACGHETSKCELIIMGGTFLRMSKRYKQSFIKGVFDGLNGKKSKTLIEAQKQNERAKNRAVGLTIETRPDVCGKEEINEMLSFGATRVELGVQHPDDAIYKTLNRGHKTQDVINATALLKDSAFKVCYHLMPGLPGSDKKKDIAMVKRIFSNPDFMPDMLKIYPTLVMPDTGLAKLVAEGKYSPYDTAEAADTISEFYRHIPEYVRVMRIQRDIPTGLIGCGVKNSNLRQLVENRMREKKIVPKEIRLREIGLNMASEQSERSEFKLKIKKYNASGGEEIFISSVNKNNMLAGFIRLRIPNTSFRKEITLNPLTALIRELHVYGSEVEVGGSSKGKAQHSGFGSQLLAEAERLANEEFDSKKMIIISGIGVREYYRKHGYKLEGAYMGKPLL